MAVVDTTNSFVNNEQITSVKLNNIMDNSFFVSGAVVTSGGLEVTAGGQMQVASSGIVTTKIADLNVTTAKIADLNVTVGKLETSLDLSGKTVTLPNASVTPAKLSQPLTSGTAVTASGSSVTFGSIPSWVTKVTLLFNDLSTNGTTVVQVRAGTGGALSATGYLAFQARISGAATCDLSQSTTGVEVFGSAASSVRSGSITFIRLGSSNTWIIEGMSSTTTTADSSRCCFYTGNVALSGELDIIGITCGANTFDAGTLNVIYQ
jgi:hypothetical protein